MAAGRGHRRRRRRRRLWARAGLLCRVRAFACVPSGRKADMRAAVGTRSSRPTASSSAALLPLHAHVNNAARRHHDSAVCAYPNNG